MRRVASNANVHQSADFWDREIAETHSSDGVQRHRNTVGRFGDDLHGCGNSRWAIASDARNRQLA